MPPSLHEESEKHATPPAPSPPCKTSAHPLEAAPVYTCAKKPEHVPRVIPVPLASPASHGRSSASPPPAPPILGRSLTARHQLGPAADPEASAPVLGGGPQPRQPPPTPESAGAPCRPCSGPDLPARWPDPDRGRGMQSVATHGRIPNSAIVSGPQPPYRQSALGWKRLPTASARRSKAPSRTPAGHQRREQNPAESTPPA
jgi:hypothetical protein